RGIRAATDSARSARTGRRRTGAAGEHEGAEVDVARVACRAVRGAEVGSSRMLIPSILALGGLLFLLGARLLMLAGRTRQLPELLVGLFFILLGPFGTLRLTVENLGVDHVRSLAAFSSLGVNTAIALVCVFTYRTF